MRKHCFQYLDLRESSYLPIILAAVEHFQRLGHIWVDLDKHLVDTLPSWNQKCNLLQHDAIT